MRAVGFTCGIGSMLLGARNAGFDIVGNIEWRKYYHKPDGMGRSTFKENFRKAFMVDKPEALADDLVRSITGIELALGHPECGNFSNLNANRGAVNDPGDIPLYVDMVSRFKPRFFVMDDLPKSFIAYSMQAYAERLPEYDLFPEWISNWGYGNVQKQRNRMFMLGALKTEGYAFVPGEEKHTKKVSDIIGDLWEGDDPRPGANYPPNHDPHTLTANCAKGLHLKYQGHRATWGEMRDYVLNELKEGGPITYIGPEGKVMTRVGSYKGHWHGSAHVLTGGISGFHPLRGVPYTIRERARLQGFPDDFVFYGTELDDQGRWNHDRNMHMVRQTGKAMPVQFCEYVSRQMAAHIRGEDFQPTRRRVLEPNQYISQAKSWYCANVGYADQAKACAACWLYDSCSIRTNKYGVGLPPHAVARREVESVDLPAQPSEAPAAEEHGLPTGQVSDPPVKISVPRGKAPGRSRGRVPAEQVIAADSGTNGPVVKPRGETKVKPGVDYITNFEEDFGNV